MRICNVLALVILASAGVCRADVIAGQAAYARGDYAAAAAEWRPLAQAGDATAALNLAALYDTGHGVPQDFGQAMLWYRRAADSGSSDGMFDVGVMYDSGRGVSVDRREAARWYTMAARRGHARAAYDLALMYEHGDGLRRDPAAAERLFQQADAHGIAAARVKLAALAKARAIVKAATLQATATTQSSVQAALQPAPAAGQPSPPPQAEPPQVIANAPSAPAPTTTAAPQTAPPADAESQTATAEQPGTPDAASPADGPSASESGTNRAEPGLPGQGIAAQDFLMVQNSILEHRDAAPDPAASRILAEFLPAMQQEARGGNELAAYDLGYCYANGIGVAVDKVKAYVNYVRAATTAIEPKLKNASLGGAQAIGASLSAAEHKEAQDLLQNGNS